MSEQGNPRRITCDGCGRSQEVDNEPMIEIDGLSEDEMREIAKSFGAYEIAAKDARIAELEAEITILNRIVNLWDKACDIAESHLQGYVNVGDSLFNGIPKLAAERDELRSDLAASKAREGEAAGLIKDFSDIVNNSSGVMGWHLNGDEASWGELLDEGHHEIIESFLTRLKERQ